MLQAGLVVLLFLADDQVDEAAGEVFARTAVMDVAHPVNPLNGMQEIPDHFIRLLMSSLAGAARRDEIFISGLNRRSNGGGWIASFTRYVGNFRAPFVGTRSSGRLSFLRSGEFCRLE